MSNAIVTHEFEVIHQTQAIRAELMKILTDADLAYRLPGENPTLGELCREMGQVEQSYIDSFKTFKQSFAYPNVDPALESRVEQLKAWYQQLERELDATLEGLSDEQVDQGMIDRGWPCPTRVQVHVYREGLLIFYGKATCYVRALGKALPQQMKEWIG